MRNKEGIVWRFL